MEAITYATFILGIILGSGMLFAVIYNYLKKQIIPVGALVLTAFGTLLLGLSIWQSARITMGPDGNFSAEFERFKQEISEEVDKKNEIAKMEVREEVQAELTETRAVMNEKITMLATEIELDPQIIDEIKALKVKDNFNRNIHRIDR